MCFVPGILMNQTHSISTSNTRSMKLFISGCKSTCRLSALVFIFDTIISYKLMDAQMENNTRSKITVLLSKITFEENHTK